MIPYYLVLSCVALCTAFVRERDLTGKTHLVIYISITALLVFYSGFREAGVGADDITYIRAFLDAPSLLEWISGSYKYSIDDNWMEPGYSVLMSLVSVISRDYRVLFFTVAALSVSAISISFWKLSPAPFIALLVYTSHAYLLRDLTQIRFGLAVSILLLSLHFLSAKRIIATVALIILATSVHFTSILFFFVIFLAVNSLSFWASAILLIISGALGYLNLTRNILANLPELWFISEKIGHYTNSEFGANLPIASASNFKNIVTIVICGILWKRLIGNEHFRLCFSIFAFGASWRLAFADFSIIAGRGAALFTSVEPILLGMIVSTYGKSRWALACVVVYSFLTLSLNMVSNDIRNYSTSLFGL